MNSELENALRSVLDFVERWNKYDEEKEVAEAAQTINAYLNSFD